MTTNWLDGGKASGRRSRYVLHFVVVASFHLYWFGDVYVLVCGIICVVCGWITFCCCCMKHYIYVYWNLCLFLWKCACVGWCWYRATTSYLAIHGLSSSRRCSPFLSLVPLWFPVLFCCCLFVCFIINLISNDNGNFLFCISLTLSSFAFTSSSMRRMSAMVNPYQLSIQQNISR